MKRALFLTPALCIGLFAPPAFSQEPEQGKPASSEEAGEANLGIWRLVNFIILVGGLGSLIVKNAGPFFDSRLKRIRQEMFEAHEARKAAELRAAEVDRRLAGLESDIAALRAESQREAAAEQERMRQQATTEMAKIRAHTEQEISGAAKAARAELKRYSAALAVGLAEQKLRARITPETQDSLVRGFMRDLDRSPAPVEVT